MPELDVHDGWKQLTFGQMAEHVAVRVEPTPEDGALYVGLEHLDSGSLMVHRWGADVPLIGTKLRARKGDILFARRNAYLRRVALAPHDGLFSAHGMVLRARPQLVLPEFLPFFMQSDVFMDRAVQISVGSLSPTINWGTLSEQAFLLPPLPEQGRIAAALSVLLTLEERLGESLTRAAVLRRAAIQSLFDTKTNGWTVRSIGDVLKVSTGGTPSRDRPDFWGGDIPWVKTGEVNFGVITHTEERITQAGLQSSATKLYPESAVLIAMYGQGPTRGRVGMLGIAAAVNQACAVISPSPDFEPWFIYFYLEGQYEALRAMAQGAAQPNLNLAMIKSYPIPSPSRSMQQEALSKVAAIAKAQDALSDRREELRSLRAHLLAEALR
jgi:type I restriction enzyme S subunit